ncbi:MAG: hypothetical protein AAFN93_02680 [Bacteroidota bacterium]
MNILDFLTSPIGLTLLIVTLEVIVRIIPTNRDISIINNFLDVLTGLLDIIPNRSGGESRFSMTSNRVRGIAKELIPTNDQGKTVLGRLVRGILGLKF